MQLLVLLFLLLLSFKILVLASAITFSALRVRINLPEDAKIRASLQPVLHCLGLLHSQWERRVSCPDGLGLLW